MSEVRRRVASEGLAGDGRRREPDHDHDRHDDDGREEHQHHHQQQHHHDRDHDDHQSAAPALPAAPLCLPWWVFAGALALVVCVWIGAGLLLPSVDAVVFVAAADVGGEPAYDGRLPPLTDDASESSLPSPSSSSSSSSSSSVALLDAALDRLQARDVASACPCGVLVMTLHESSQGLGVQLSSYVAALSAALRANRTLLFDGSWNYAGPTACGGGDLTGPRAWGCFFESAVPVTRACADAIARFDGDGDFDDDDGSAVVASSASSVSASASASASAAASAVPPAWRHAVLLGRTNLVKSGPMDPSWPSQSAEEAAEDVSDNENVGQGMLAGTRLAWHRDLLQPPSWWQAGRRLWEARLFAHLWRPNVRARRVVDRNLRNWGWPPLPWRGTGDPDAMATTTTSSSSDGDGDLGNTEDETLVVGVHIRRRDRTDLLRYDVDDYMALAREAAADLLLPAVGEDAAAGGVGRDVAAMMRQRVRLFVATDDPSYVRPRLRPHRADFLDIRMPPGLPAGVSFGDYRHATDPPAELALAAIAEIELLSRTHVLVAAQRSMFAWVASRVQMGRREPMLPPPPAVAAAAATTAVRRCPRWIGHDTSNPYGWWDPSKGDVPEDGTCV